MENINDENEILNVDLDQIDPVVDTGELKGTRIGEENNFEQEIAHKEIVGEEYSLQESLMKENDVSLLNIGDMISGKIAKIEKDGIIVDINYKSDGFIPFNETGLDDLDEIKEQFQVDNKIKLKVVSMESREGLVLLSKKKADMQIALDELERAYHDKLILEANVENSVKGGLIVRLSGYKGFLPASHVVRRRSQELDDFVGGELPVIIIDFDKRRQKMVVSNKQAQNFQKTKDSEKDIIDKLEAGSIVKGKVSSIKKFGVFVDLGGVEGLIHISELSWCRVNKPEDVVKIGDEIDVFVLGVDKENKKISLGYKQLFPDPWDGIEEELNIGDVVMGRISRIVSFGAFVALESGLEGLVHISEIADENVKRVEDKLDVGDKVKVKILRITPEEKKIGLSMKDVDEHQENKGKNEADEEDNKVTIGDMVDFKYDSNLSISEEDDKLVEEAIEEANSSKYSDIFGI